MAVRWKPHYYLGLSIVIQVVKLFSAQLKYVNLRPITGNLIPFTSPDGGETIAIPIIGSHSSGSRIAGTYSLFAS